MSVKIRDSNVTGTISDARDALNDRTRKFWRLARIVVDSNETVTKSVKNRRWKIVAENLDRSRRSSGRLAEGFVAPTLRTTVSGKSRKWDRKEATNLRIAVHIDSKPKRVREAQESLRAEICVLQTLMDGLTGKAKRNMRSRIHETKKALAL